MTWCQLNERNSSDIIAKWTCFYFAPPQNAPWKEVRILELRRDCLSAAISTQVYVGELSSSGFKREGWPSSGNIDHPMKEFLKTNDRWSWYNNLSGACHDNTHRILAVWQKTLISLWLPNLTSIHRHRCEFRLEVLSSLYCLLVCRWIERREIFCEPMIIYVANLVCSIKMCGNLLLTWLILGVFDAFSSGM